MSAVVDKDVRSVYNSGAAAEDLCLGFKCFCRIDLNNSDSGLWTYVIDNWNNGYLGI